jgi:hypothetical protein
MHIIPLYDLDWMWVGEVFKGRCVCEEKRKTWNNIVFRFMLWRMVEDYQVHYFFLFILTSRKVGKIFHF